VEGIFFDLNWPGIYLCSKPMRFMFLQLMFEDFLFTIKFGEIFKTVSGKLNFLI
jgi:hypothetical protein